MLPVCRNPCCQDPLSTADPGIHVPHAQQPLALHDAVAIDIRWKRPMQISQLTAWGGSPQEFNLLFSFWAKWARDAHPRATPIISWMQAFIIFLSVGGFKAPFVSKCAYIGMAIYKFRILSCSLLKMAAATDSQFRKMRHTSVGSLISLRKLRFPTVFSSCLNGT